MASNRTREPLRGAFIAILAAAIGAGGTLIGNQLASSNARAQLSAQFSHDDSIRQHDSRRDVYAKFISAASQYQIDLIRSATRASNRKSQNMSDSEFQQITGDSAQLQTVYSEVQIVGSTKAAGLAVEVRKALEDILNATDPNEVTSRAFDDVGPKLELFVVTARDELNN